MCIQYFFQKRVQEELDNVFGRSSRPTLDTPKESLPYTHAVIEECYRKTSLAHTGVPHSALADLKVGDRIIPAGTIIIQNLYGIHHDPRYWDEPEKFLPERFLDADGNFKGRGESLHPFGIGRRYCLGQSLAEKEFFLFFTGILHRFKLERVEGECLPGNSSFNIYIFQIGA